MSQKKRGPTFMRRIWGFHPSQIEGERMNVQFNKNGQPIGTNKKVFVEFLGSIARNGKYAPLDIKTWNEMPKSLKKDMLDVIKEKFDLASSTEAWTLQSINKKWKNWKADLKKNYYDPDLPVKQLIYNKPSDTRVSSDQWKSIVLYWNSEDAKLLSKKNKESRAKRAIMHTTGKKSFAQVGDNEEKILGRPPTRVEMFEKCYTKNGVSSNDKVVDALVKMKELKNNQTEASLDYGTDDIFSKVMGPDKGGRIRMFGLGMTTTDAWGELPSRNGCYRMAMGYKETVENLQKQVSEQCEEIANLKSNMQERQLHPPRTSQHISLANNYQTRLEVGIQVNIRSFIDPTKIVGVGRIKSLNPLDKVGGHEIGPSWCELIVIVPIDWDEHLIKPYKHFKTIADVIGVSIAWPQALVFPKED